MISPSLPRSVKRNADLFEIGFAFLLLPSMVATMDRPPFFLGGKILLWMGTWFLVRRLSADDRTRVFGSLKALSWPQILIGLFGLALLGAGLASFSGLERFQHLVPTLRWISGALLLPLFALVVSLPVVVLAFGYLPVRFASSTWFPNGLILALPVLGFATLHLSTFGWKAPLTALVLGVGASGIYKGRIPLVGAILVHALVGWMGVVGNLW